MIYNSFPVSHWLLVLSHFSSYMPVATDRASHAGQLQGRGLSKKEPTGSPGNWEFAMADNPQVKQSLRTTTTTTTNNNNNMASY
jgi:hypothetical protein